MIIYGYSLMTVCSFVDRDMLMRHFSHGVGHLQHRTRRPQNSDDSEFDYASTAVDADLVSDSDLVSDTSHEQECDVNVDSSLEEESELEGDSRLDSDVDCDSSTIASDSDSYASF